MSEYTFAILFFGLFIFMGVNWFIFSRISIPRIDKQMIDDGQARACPIDIVGLRVMMIAGAISLPVGNIFNHEDDPLIDVKALRPYGTVFDRRVGLLLSLSIYSLLIVGLVGVFYF
ncbi:MAG: hypothetical protein ABNH16_14855 [Thalassolituus sp.]|jgi:hypothetical protein